MLVAGARCSGPEAACAGGDAGVRLPSVGVGCMAQMNIRLTRVKPPLGTSAAARRNALCVFLPASALKNLHPYLYAVPAAAFKLAIYAAAHNNKKHAPVVRVWRMVAGIVAQRRGLCRRRGYRACSGEGANGSWPAERVPVATDGERRAAHHQCQRGAVASRQHRADRWLFPGREWRPALPMHCGVHVGSGRTSVLPAH